MSTEAVAEPADFTREGQTLGNVFLQLPYLLTGVKENNRDFRSDLCSVAGIIFYLLTQSAPVMPEGPAPARLPAGHEKHLYSS